MKSNDLLKPYILENRSRILLGVLCLIVVDFLQLCIPRVIKWTVDDLTVFQATPQAMMTYALYILALAMMIGLLRYVWRRCLIGTSRRVEEGLRNRLFRHIQTLSAPYFDRVTTGDLMARATNDIQNIRMATGMGIVALTDAVVLGAAAIGFMAYIHVRLTLYVLIPMPFIVLGTRVFSRKLHRRYLAVQGTFADMTEMVRERFAGIRMIKAHNMQRASDTAMAAVSNRYIRENLRLVAITRSLFPMMVFLSNVSLAIILFLGGRQTIRGEITPGDFVAFISYLGLLTWPMMAMGWVTNLIQRGKASLDRIDAVLKVRPDVENRPDGIMDKSAENPVLPAGARPGGRRGPVPAVVFDSVSFAHGLADGNPQPVLAEVDFSVRTGTVLGVVGPPGSGKTTALNLIPRIYDVTGGSIRINGTDVRRMDLADLRSRIGFVPQEPFLFAGTIRDNIVFGDPDISDADLDRAVNQACLTETIDDLQRGWDTLVGEKGVILSGGQKQRIALARAFVCTAPILILDDPISQVDPDTGDVIVRTLRAMAGERTVVVVSHRLSAVRFSDRIIVLDRGRIVESGNHRALMANDAYYARTFRLQAMEEDHYDAA